MAVLDVHGTEIGYDDAGTGPPLVLIHGHPFDRTMWRPQVAAFGGAGWRVVAPDLRGYGATPPVEGTVWEDFAHDVLSLLDRLGLVDVVVAGLSMGGQIAMECLRLAPDRFAGLVLADTTAAAETSEGRSSRHRMAHRVLDEGLGGYTAETLTRMMTPANVAGMPATAAHVRGMMLGTSPAGAATALRARADRPDYRDLLTTTDIPVLVVVGEGDTLNPVADARSMAEAAPRSTMVVVPGAAHLPNLERPEMFDHVLGDFLRGECQRSGRP